MGKVRVQPVLLLVRLRALAQVDDHLVDAVGQVLPASRHPRHVRLTTELALRTDLTRDADHLCGEGAELIDHRVHRGLQLADLAARGNGDLVRELSVGDCGRHQRDVAHLRGQVPGQRVDAFGEVLPGPGDPWHLRLAAELSLRADFAGDTRHFRREGPQLVDHLVDRLLEVEDLPLGGDGDLPRQIAARDRRGDQRDVAYLVGQVAGQHVHVVGQVFPDAGDAANVRLSAQPALRTDLPRNPCDLGREGAELVDHGVDGVLQRQDLTPDVHRDLLREVAVGDRGGHLRDVAHLIRQVPGEDVDVVGQVLPGSAHTLHVRLAPELSLGAHFARDPRHFSGEGAQLIHHLVDGLFQLEDLALRRNADLARQVAARHGRGHFRDVAHLGGEVVGEQVHVVGEVLPGAGDSGDIRLRPQFALHSDGARHAGDLLREDRERPRHVVERLAQCRDLALRVYLKFSVQVAIGDRGHDLDDAPDLGGQVRGHGVHVVGEVLPDARHALDVGLAAQLALHPHLASDPRDFRGKRPQLVDHLVDRLLQLQDLALGGNADLLREIAARHRGGDERDVPHLGSQIGGEQIDGVDQLFPGAARPRYLRLSAQPARGPHLSSDADDFGADGAQPRYQRVHAAGHAQRLPAQRSALRRFQGHHPR